MPPAAAAQPPVSSVETSTSARSSTSGSEVAAPAKPRSRATRVLLGLGLVAALAGGGYAVATAGIEDTDNAQIDADVVAVPARVAGAVVKVHFRENEAVRAGALLAELDDAPFRAKLAQAEASLLAAEAAARAAGADAKLVTSQAIGNRAVARANLASNHAGVRASDDEIRLAEAQVETAAANAAQAERDLERATSLFASGATTAAQQDKAVNADQVARASLAAARARLSSMQSSRAQSRSKVAEATAKLEVSDNVDTLVQQAEARAANAHAQAETARAARDLAALELSYTKIHAPHDGVASKKSINEGQAIASGQTIVQLVPDARWVTANFKETQVAHMRPGQPVKVSVDAFPDVKLTGRVQSFSGATGARFTLLPPDNATGNFTKVVQRIPVRIALDAAPEGVPLLPGMSVTVKVDTNEG